MFDKVLIANRGEVALRVHRACREMGIRTVAVHSEADAEAMHVRLADESVCIGPPPASGSYLNAPAIISAAIVTNADAIHPGIGFLSEDSSFARIVEEHGIVFIGPDSSHMALMGDKAEARRFAARAGLKIVAGADIGESEEEARVAAAAVGFPLMLKASGGGGGHGMRIVRDMASLGEALMLTRREAQSHFGNDAVYMEKYLSEVRHIEVQLLGDREGRIVHLGERECSLQRRHQKVLEEAPSQALNRDARERVCAAAVALAASLGYYSTGTVEFLYADGEVYFIEMNTRLQVEHPVTEMLTGIDLVREQIKVAAGKNLEFRQEDINFSGHAIECRINAEDPHSFAPRPGRVESYHAPGGLDVRVDSALYAGYVIPPWYDSLIAKLIVHGASRNECLMRLRRALEEFVIVGVPTTISFHQRLIRAPDFLDARYDTGWLESWLKGATGVSGPVSAAA